jgi:cellulose synthase/poly-beta-1,6-N-acetylglucosamine synthase-like glycosyltransferase
MLFFCLSAGLISYITLGYPVLLALLARRYSRPFQRGDQLFRVSIVIPVHNGGRFLRRKLESILNLDYPSHLVEVLVVSDGSVDETTSIAMEFSHSGIQLLSVPRLGKAAALNAAVPQLHGEILVLTDVRQDLAPDSLRRLMAPFVDPAVGVVSGELVLREGTTQSEADVGIYWRYESWIRRNLSLLDSMMGATGPFYGIRRKLFQPIPEDILLDDVYLPMTAFFRNFRLVLEPKAIAYDYPINREQEFRRKVRTLGGNYQLLLRMPALWSPSNRLFLHFLSYKVGRLFLPWLTIALLLSSLRLPAPWNVLWAGCEAAFGGLAFADRRIPQRSILKRISSPARTFVVLMAATVQGLKVLFVPPRSLWKVTDIASDS